MVERSVEGAGVGGSIPSLGATLAILAALALVSIALIALALIDAALGFHDHATWMGDAKAPDFPA